MRRHAKPIIGFSLFAVLALLVTYIIWSTLERAVPGDTESYSATFTNVSGLKVGDDVRMAGVRVGRVESVELDDDQQARVTFEVLKEQPLYSNIKATVKYQNLVGQRYLGLEVPIKVGNDGQPLPMDQLRGEKMKPGWSIARTDPSFDVSVLLNGFRPVFDVLDPNEANQLSATLVQAFQGNEVSLSNTLRQLGGAAKVFGDRDELLKQVIDNLAVLMGDLAKNGNLIKSTATNVANVISGLNSRSASLGASVAGLGNAVTGLGDLFASIRPTMQDANRNLNQATRNLIQVGAPLDTVAVNLPKVLARLAKTTSTGAYLNMYICDLDVSLYGVLFPKNTFNQIGGTRQSAVCQ